MLADRWGCTPADVWPFLIGGKLGVLYTIIGPDLMSGKAAHSEFQGHEREDEHHWLKSAAQEIRAQFDGIEQTLPSSELKELNPSELRREWHFEVGNVYVSLEEVYQFEHQNSINRRSRNPISRLRDSRRHRERCRCIAALLWEKSPDRTIVDVLNSHEIVAHGCEGKIYAPKTLRNWIKDLAPNRNPGRRPSQN